MRPVCSGDIYKNVPKNTRGWREGKEGKKKKKKLNRETFRISIYSNLSIFLCKKQKTKKNKKTKKNHLLLMFISTIQHTAYFGGIYSRHVLRGEAGRDVEVHDIQGPGFHVHHDVAWVDVPVHHSCLVDVCDTPNYKK
jgi:hypothetical protein